MSQAELLSPTHFSPSVFLYSGRPATTSLEVAKFFGKRHTDVLRDVNNFSANCPEEFSQRNFASAEYSDEQGKPRPMFILYRDGFMLLVMGYTGKKALAMKLAYIEAFNRMEAELAEQHAALSAATPDDIPGTVSPLSKRTDPERKQLTAIINTWVGMAPIHYASARAQVNAHFGVTGVDKLTVEQVKEAIRWVQARIDALPAPAPAGALPSTPSAAVDEVEDHLAAIREHVRQIHRHEEALFMLARKALPPVRKPGDMFSPARRTGLTAFQSMEDCAGALDYSLRALESAARTMLTLGR